MLFLGGWLIPEDKEKLYSKDEPLLLKEEVSDLELLLKLAEESDVAVCPQLTIAASPPLELAEMKLVIIRT